MTSRVWRCWVSHCFEELSDDYPVCKIHGPLGTKKGNGTNVSNGPVEPNADMRVFASHMRQMFLALTQEGFTETQALVMCGNVISAGMRNNKDD